MATEFASGISALPIYAERAGADQEGYHLSSTYQKVSGMSAYAQSSEVSGVIDTVSSNSASWGGGVDSATVSAIASAYAESAQFVSATASAIDTASKYWITSINGFDISAGVAGEDASGRPLTSLALSSDVSGVIDTVSSNSASWGGGGATGDYVEKSATEVAIGSANSASYLSFAQGSRNAASSYSFAQGFRNKASSNGLAQGYYNSAYGTSFAQGSNNSAEADSFAQGYYNSANTYSFAQGLRISAKNTAAVFGRYNLRGDGETATGNSAAFAIGDGTSIDSRHDLMLVTKDGEITMYSSTADTAGTGIMSSIRAISAAATGGGGDYLTSKVGSGRATFTTAFQDGMDKRPALCINGERGVDSAVYPRMLITDWNRSTGDTHSGTLLANAFEFYTCPTSARGEVDPSGVLLARLDDNKVEFNLDSSVTSKNRSAHFGRDGIFLGVSGASGSSIQIVNEKDVAPYIVLDDNSGVTGRIEPSSMGYWNNKLDGSASISFYTTANESGYVDSAYVDSAVSGKQDSLTFAYDVDSAISSINGSALATGAQVVTSITTGGYGVRAINGWTINASHMVLGAAAADNNNNIVQLGNNDYGPGVFLTGQFGTAYYKINELQLNRNGTGFIAFNIGGAGSQITATSNAGGKFSAGGTKGSRSYYTAFNASASASIEVTGSTSMINIADTGYTSTIYPSSIQSWNGKMDSSAVQSAYASASATQATAANVLYILLPDGA